jgi:hypothetical protein
MRDFLFFGTLSSIKPEHCVNFGRIGYTSYGQIFKNKYKPRAFMCNTVGYVENHNPHTNKVFLYVPSGPGEIIITRNSRWEHWDHPLNHDHQIHNHQFHNNQLHTQRLQLHHSTRVDGLNPQQQEHMAKIIDYR